MKLEIIDIKDRKAKFVLSEVTPAFANSLRRAMISDVPKMAIDYIDLYDNTSVLFDEMLSLRLGLVPLKTNADMYQLPAGMRLQWRRLRPLPGVADPVGRRVRASSTPGTSSPRTRKRCPRTRTYPSSS